jgi:two-component system CheB/CheR fusion protein
VFESFAQADQSLDRSGGGLGLGLALVKGLIELHGGQVQATSAGPGCGAEFSFALPIEDSGASGSDYRQTQQSGPLPIATGPIQTPRGHPKPKIDNPVRILLVEDNPDAAQTLREALELLGHSVSVAGSGPAGIEAARRLRPEVVLCDIGLPGMDGYGVAGALRADPETADARLIAMSGYGQPEDRRRSEAAGFEQHLVKPVNLPALQRLLTAEPERRSL